APMAAPASGRPAAAPTTVPNAPPTMPPPSAPLSVWFMPAQPDNVANSKPLIHSLVRIVILPSCVDHNRAQAYAARRLDRQPIFRHFQDDVHAAHLLQCLSAVCRASSHFGHRLSGVHA